MPRRAPLDPIFGKRQVPPLVIVLAKPDKDTPNLWPYVPKGDPTQTRRNLFCVGYETDFEGTLAPDNHPELVKAVTIRRAAMVSTPNVFISGGVSSPSLPAASIIVKNAASPVAVASATTQQTFLLPAAATTVPTPTAKTKRPREEDHTQPGPRSKRTKHQDVPLPLSAAPVEPLTVAPQSVSMVSRSPPTSPHHPATPAITTPVLGSAIQLREDDVLAIAVEVIAQLTAAEPDQDFCYPFDDGLRDLERSLGL